MKKIKVYLQYPWKFPDSPYYKYLVENLPKNVEYINAEKQKGVIVNKKLFWFSNFLKRNIKRLTNKLNLSIPNARLSPKGNYDLIHCAHCLSKNKNKPWIVDIEGEWQLYIGKKTKNSKEKVREILMSKNCKKIVPWAEKTKKEILKEFPEIKDKVKVVYPTIPVHKKISKKNKNDKITILYATRYFWLKGGIIALEVYKKLKERYGDKIELIFISDVPEKVKEKYPKLKIRNLVSNKELFKLYKKSDIFFYPSFADTFGFGLLEAMSFGLPTITVNTKHTLTRKEIIENNKHGFVFNISDEITEKLIKEKEILTITDKEKEIINKLFENCSKLIKNKKLREKMSKNSIEMIKKGGFSIEERNKKLEKIYREALK
jgi:glycosyltransferase involved in cell wall biosynthesis